MAGRVIIELFVRLLDDLTCETIKDKFEDKERECTFLERVRGEWLDSFTDDDQIYQEFEVSTEECSTVQEEEGYELESSVIPSRTWRVSRPVFKQTVLRSLLHGFVIVLTGIIIGCLAVGAMFLTLKVCPFQVGAVVFKFKLWNCKGMDIVVVALVHSWIATNLTFVFGWRSLKTTWVYPIALIAFLVDVTYRIVLLYTGVDKLVELTVSLKIPLNVLILISWFAQSYSVTSVTPIYSVKKRLCLAVKLTIPPLFSAAITYICFYGIYPLYSRTESTWGKFAIAVFAPVVGSVLKSVVRIIVQRFYYVNHPGTSFIFIVYTYLISAILFRILQVELNDLEFISVVGIIHGIVEVLERSSLVLRDHLDNQLYERHFAPVGAFRTPRSERLTADIALMSMMYEASSVVVTNGLIFCFRVLHGNALIVDLKKFAVFTGVQVGIEWVFTSISLAIESHFQNMAVFRIWGRRKWLHIGVALFNFILAAMFNPNYFNTVMEKSNSTVF